MKLVGIAAYGLGLPTSLVLFCDITGDSVISDCQKAMLMPQPSQFERQASPDRVMKLPAFETHCVAWHHQCEIRGSMVSHEE